MKSAIKYNKNNAIPLPWITCKKPETLEFAEDIAEFQESAGITVDGKCGPTTIAHARQYLFDYFGQCPPPTLGKEDYLEVARLISRFEGHFWSTNRDGEYKGLFDRPGKPHWASGKIHIGLSYGFIQFTQDGGSLGKLLKLMHDKDPQKFDEVFAPYAQELIEVTNRPGRARTHGRSPRVQPVGGRDIWSSWWVKKFKEAGKHPPFQQAQLELAISEYMNPAIKICQELGLQTQRSLAMVFDRSVHYGPRGAKSLIMRSADSDLDEHLRLRRLLKSWKGRRWYHRPLKIYMSQTLGDSICAFG